VGPIELQPAHADDIARMCELLRRAEVHDGVPRLTETDDLREVMGANNVALPTDARLACVDGQLAGYVYTYYLPSDRRLERCYIFGTVDPAWRERGVGRTMLRWGIERATAQLRSSANDLPKYIRVDGYDSVESAHRLFARMGFTRVRWFDELLRPLDTVPDRQHVEGIEIVPWPAGRDEEARQMKNLAFDDHWGSTPTSAENWQSNVHGYGGRPDLSFVAIGQSTGRIVAVCVNHRYESYDEVIGRREGWIETLGTLPEWRGRGLASALIVQSLHAFVDAGLTHASIAVDSANPTGAARLYRALGFEPHHRSITHEIELS
jgi:ribosomal protein S18 acetylase RimI-like enzyme